MISTYAHKRTKFAWIPVTRVVTMLNKQQYKQGFYWLQKVTMRKVGDEWLAFDIDNEEVGF